MFLGTDLSKDIFGTEKLNGSRKSVSELNFDEFGPETNVDTVDDVLSPIEKEKAFTESLVKGNLIISIPRFFNSEGQFINQLDYYRIDSISVQPYNNQHVLTEILVLLLFLFEQKKETFHLVCY